MGSRQKCEWKRGRGLGSSRRKRDDRNRAEEEEATQESLLTPTGLLMEVCISATPREASRTQKPLGRPTRGALLRLAAGAMQTPGRCGGRVMQTGQASLARAVLGGEILDVQLTQFVLERDFALLESWLTRPHVARWWGDPAKALQDVSQPPAGGGEALISVDGAPVGYVRWQVPLRRELDAAGLHEVPDDAIDIDIAIGEGDLLGKDIGSRALSILRERLLREGVTTVMLATSVDNTRAIHAYQRAGFVRRRRFVDTDGGSYWLMVSEATPG
jgi:aminoglycoside 6'-N-acetyltransferase